MDGLKLEKSRWFFMLNDVEYIDLPLIITMLRDLCALQNMLAHVSAVVQCEIDH